jgi:hypothetical protein
MTAAIKPSYRRTEAKYKGGALEMYVTYDLEQRTRGAKTAVYPKVKRVYIAGEVRGWKAGDSRRRPGAECTASASNTNRIAAAIGALASTRSAVGPYTGSSRHRYRRLHRALYRSSHSGAGEKPSFLSRPRRAAGTLPRRFAARPLGSAGHSTKSFAGRLDRRRRSDAPLHAL